MGKKLVIAEKPSVALDLASALGAYEAKDKGEYYETDDYVISFAVGHLLELVAPERYDEKWKRWSLKTLPMIPETFKHSARGKKASSRLKVLKTLAKRKDVTGVINACDAGREGELIFRTIFNKLGKALPVERLWLNSLTSGAIRKGFSELRPGSDFDDLGAAAQSRSEADWLIGINATRALTVRLRSFNYGGAWTAGRVQTPTLAMCVEREIEIQAHKAEPYWEVLGQFKAIDHDYEGKLFLPRDKAREREQPTRIFDKAQVDAIVASLEPDTKTTASEKRRKQKDSPPLPFDLTSLQRATGLTAKRTQDIAQALYERHKVLSYPRTDSRYLPEDQRPDLEANLEQVRAVAGFAPALDAILAAGVQNPERIFNDSKVTDHHAIIPVGVPAPGQLDETELRIYKLVCSQYLAAFMTPAYWESVSRRTIVHTPTPLEFRCSGRVLVEPGWHLAFGRFAGHGSSLVALTPKDDAPVTLLSNDMVESMTRPRGRLSDAGLLSKMENAGKEIEDEAFSEAMNERGLGTPATRADTIERLIQRGYLAREGKSLRAAAKAIRLVETLQRANVLNLTSPELTGEMEHKLRQVEQGKLKREAYMKEVAENTTVLADLIGGFDFDDLYKDEVSVGAIPNNPNTTIIENAWGFASDDGDDPFFIWKDVGGHVLTPPEMTEIIEAEDHELGPLMLFPRNSQGRGYKAMLKLRRIDDEEYEELSQKSKKPDKKTSRWTIDIKPLDGGPEQAPEVEEEVIGPFCKTADGVQIIETTIRYVDAELLSGERKKPRAVLPKLVCHRPITDEEAENFFCNKDTDFLDNFISKRGRAFRAKLILKDNGRHGFVFEPRQPRKKAADGDVKATKKKTAKKATKKKTAKKATKKKTTKKATKKKTTKKATKKKTTKKATKKKTTKKATTKKDAAVSDEVATKK